MSSTMPNSTMLTWSSGSMTPASIRRTSSTLGGANAVGGDRLPEESGGTSVIDITLIKPGSALKICPGLATVNGVDLAVLKALGDETRYAMYRELATSTRPLSAQELADRLGLHANTVRLHLDRLRETGLVEAEAMHRGTVGRPQHLYSLAPGAPTLGFDPPAHALLAGLLGALAEHVGATPEDATEIGEQWGAELTHRTRSRSCITALADELDRPGFEPAVGHGGR